MFKSNNKKNQSESGQAIIISVIFFLFISLAIIFGMVSPLVRETKIARELHESKKSYYLAEAGYEDVIYRIWSGLSVSSIEEISLSGNTATTTIIDFGSDDKQVVTEGEVAQAIRRIQANTKIASGEASFKFGVQTEQGGFIMENSSTVTGNLYSNGTVSGSGSSQVSGTVVSAGPAGLADGVDATEDVYAHTITDATVGGDAYYNSISGSTVAGTLFPSSPDQPVSSLPLSDSLIESWKAEAALGTIISSPCPYNIANDITIGPAKIECDLIIKGSPAVTVTLTGMVWVEGDITISNSVTIRLDPSLGDRSTGFIADNESDTEGSGKITLNNSVDFLNSGTSGSYVLLLSQNNSAENNGTIVAIDAKNSVSGDLLLYAGHGEIKLGNNVDLRQVTAYRTRLENNANVIYETGLSSTLFLSGPGGSWIITDWAEVE